MVEDAEVQKRLFAVPEHQFLAKCAKNFPQKTNLSPKPRFADK
jgi:hypothetical protein